jgi:hypothetical protein
VAFSVVACLVLAGCSVAHQPVQLTLRGDGLPQNAQGRRMAAAQRGALERHVAAAVDCEHEEPCNAPPDQCKSQCVTIAPIASRLGPPPRPGDFARRIGTTRSAGSRDDARAAYADAVRERYRSYGVYISQELAGADWVEIAGPYDTPARRYRGRQVYGEIDDALVAMGDRYASLEWDRFERERAVPRPVVPTSPPTPPAHPSSRPETVTSVPKPAANVPPSPPKPPAVAEPAPPQTSDTGPPPAPAPVQQAERSAAPDLACKRVCGLRRRTCLADCRGRPVSGGEYDACAGACRGGEQACRGRCSSS